VACPQLIVGWLVLFYVYKNEKQTENVKGWGEKKENINRELRVVMVVIVYRVKKGETERALYKMIHATRPPMAARGAAVVIHDPCLPLQA